MLKDRIKELRRVPAKDLRPHPQNWRSHPEGQATAMQAVLEEIGFAGAILARETPDGLEIIDGHLRQDMLADEIVPVLVTDLTAEESRKMLLTYDPLAALAEADAEILEKLAASVEFDQAALNDLVDGLMKDYDIGQDKEVIEDEVPEPPAEPITKPGDLWICGDHRVLCGDATKAEDVARVMDGDKADACVTDPPYGVGADYESFKDTSENVAALIEKVMPLILSAPCAALTPGVPAMWLYPKPIWVGSWVHPAPCSGCPWGFVGNNPILYYGADTYLKSGKGRRPDSIVMASDRQGVEGHPTPKPIKVWAWLVERLTPEKGQLVLDPFLGSGTTIIAAEQLGRRCFGLEIEPRYVDVIVSRWEAITGKKATRG